MSLTLRRGEPLYQEVLRRVRNLAEVSVASLGTKEREISFHATPFVKRM